MLNLPNYYLSENLYQGTRTLVYRGQRHWDKKPVIIKVLRNPHPSFNELVQFRNQYIITRHLEHPAIVQPLALERYGNSYALVMEDLGAIALSDYWPNSQQSLSNFLQIAIQLAKALHYLSQQGIIHKDIKPSNILIHPETKQVQLIDFSISTLLPTEQQQLISPNVLEGTLAYISPEQTGRMNRGIDYRTDFYSLGVTFFELLTGKLPFESTDPMELVHCHIAKMPTVLGNREEIPQVLSDLVLKLMAKNAEDRYQSALGLKHDLEQCLQQLKATGEITLFELGSRDLCDRFCIPEKLYGRENEVQRLLDGFARVAQGATEMILVAGFSGIGKTAVVNEVHKPIVKQRGYFIKGKFDQFNRNIPFSAFVQAFRDLMGQLLGESDGELAVWKRKILDAVGENGQVIIDVVPEVEKIIGTQPAVTELSGTAAQNRFNLLFSKFVQVFTTKEHPLVIFLDDLQWADSASLNLLKLLMDESEVGYLLVLGAYRDNEVFPAHPLVLTLDEIQKEGAKLETLTLAPLSEKDINRLVAETLLCATSIAAPLSQLVYQKTKGNPFFTTQFLKGLYEDGCIKFNAEAGYWQCNLAELRQLALTDDVVEFMVERLHKLPEATQELFKLAACIGNRFDLATLAVVSEETQEEVAENLWLGLQEGFTIPENETYKFFQGDEGEKGDVEKVSVNYHFLHDRVQQAAYSLIPEGQKQVTHLTIGRLLLQSIPETEQEEKIFSIVNQLNLGSNLIAEAREREDLAQFNLRAGEKAKLATAFTSALEYGQTGIQLLSEKSWQEQYNLCLELHQLAAEAAYGAGEFETGENLIQLVLKSAKTTLNKVIFYHIQIGIYVAKKQSVEAVEIGRQLLKTLGLELPQSLTEEEIQQTFTKLKALIPEGGTKALLALPTSVDPYVIAVMETLAKLSTPIFTTNPTLFPLLFVNLIEQTLKHGTTAFSAVGYSLYSMLLCSTFNDLEAAYQFGELALKLLPRFNNKVVDTQILCIAGCGTHHWKIHLKETLVYYQKGVRAGLESGDFLNQAWNYAHDSYVIYLLGTPLSEASKQISVRSDAIRRLKQESHLIYNEILNQCVRNLLTPPEDPCNLTGDILNEKQMLAKVNTTQDTIALFFFYSCKFQLCYLLGRYEDGLKYADLTMQYSTMAGSYPLIPVINFYIALTHLALCDSFGGDRQKLEAISVQYEKLKFWGDSGPMNHHHKFLLIEAEKQRILGNKIDAMELYDRAIAGAKENEYLQEEALANEIAAKFYLDWGKEKIAQTYMVEAYYCYARWEALAKINQLEEKYPQLLTPILQQQQVEFNPLDSIECFTQTLTSKTQTKTTSTLLSDTLDLASILQAAQAISSIIELEPLLGKILQIILTNTGAQKAVLLIRETDQWHLRAIAQLAIDGTIETDTNSQPLTTETPVPSRLIQYVKNTQSVVLINEAKTEITGILEGYLLQYQPQSVFCVPLLHQGNLVGILYLEHPTTKGVFTTERQTIIQFLCAQAAIALQNAQLYEQAQKALRDLQKAQLQIVQSEKMSALGSLLSGIAHEINNPLGFIAGNIQLAQDNLADLLEHLQLYEENTSAEDIADHAEEIDLEYLRSDFPNILKSMNVGVEQMKNISTSLRIFSRKDQEYKTKFNIHDGIESTLVILKHRTKANDRRPAIEIMKEYEELPEINCFPGQLNQVFMNILANAIDAFDEANFGKTYAEIQEHPNHIKIRTSKVDALQVQIEIQDNGSGMKPETKDRIFEQGFTTKGVGKGTGLGMAIAHQIITEKHGGEITCNSTVGEGTIFTIILPIV